MSKELGRLIQRDFNKLKREAKRKLDNGSIDKDQLIKSIREKNR